MARSASAPAMSAWLENRQELRALPGRLQVMALLPLAHSALEARIVQAVTDNPALERSAISVCETCAYPSARPRCPHCRRSSAPNHVEPAENPFETLEAIAGCEVSAAARSALPLVIDHLTDRGLLDADPDVIAAAHEIPLGQVLEAVRAIVAVGPVGIAARSVADLLATQARVLVAAGDAPEWIIRLVGECLPLVSDHDIDAITRTLGLSVAEVEQGLQLIRRRLQPGALFRRNPRLDPVKTPDVFVYREEGHLVVRVPASDALGLVVVDSDPALRANPEASDWLERHERAARRLLHQVDVRADTLHRVATEVIRCECRYFDRGPAGQVDLTRTEVAFAVGLHPSTVSRAVSGKSLRCPDGRVIDLGDLFGNGAAIRARLIELTEGARGSGVSDAQLAARLAAEGFSIARRTVAKYRAQLGLPNRRTGS